MNTYHHSIGRNGTLLLNFPIDKRGLIHENDEKAVKALAKAVKKLTRSIWRKTKKPL
jgi:alpha-L-fucosidase